MLLLGAAWVAGTSPGAAADARGAALFERGAGAEAEIAGSGLRMPLGCAGCHGADGRGGGEGRNAAPAVTWSTLTRAAADRPGYDLPGLGRALREGLDPGGRPLAAAMPRYDLPPDLLQGLAGHLAALDRVPGVLPDRILIGAPADPEARAGFTAALAAAGDGIYGRRPEAAPPGAPELISYEAAAGLLAPRIADATVNILVATLVADGVKAVALLPPDPATEAQIAGAGIALDAAASDLLLLAEPGSAPTPLGGRVLGPAAILAPRLAAIEAAGGSAVMVAPASLAAAGSGRAAAAEARQIGDLLVAALLECGRSVTREALTSRLSVLPVDGSLEVYVLNRDGD